MENPTTLPCGHSFCRDKCLVQWLKQKESASCPICREPIPSSPLRINIALREAIEIAKTAKFQKFKLHLSLSNATAKVSGTKEEVEKVVADVLTNTQTILHDLINNLVRESFQKIVDLDSGNPVSCSLTFDKELREKGNEFIENALEVLNSFRQEFNESFEFIEENAKSFHLKLLSKLVKKDLIDVEKFDISSRSKEILKIAQISGDFSISFTPLQELLTIELPEELKLKLLNNFVIISQTISISQFNWIKEVNPELTNVMFEKLEFNSLTEEEFLALVDTFIEHSDVKLLSKVINVFAFESLPEIPVIPGNLLSRIYLDNVSNQNKGIWLEKVILINLVGDEIQVIGRQLLGREISLRTVNVGVWAETKSYTDDITKHITRGFADNWTNIELSITSSAVSSCSFADFQGYDVVVLESWSVVTDGNDFNQLLESGKGFVFFNEVPENCTNGFIHSCANGTRNPGFLTNQQTQHDMVKTLPNDPIFLNVNRFSTNYSSNPPKSVTGTLLATVNSGIPLIVKKEVGGGRLVEFTCPSMSSDLSSDCDEEYGIWPTSTDGHKLFANAVVWAGKCI
ncbi:hypothetical protein GEMRC1_010046 [Eukaryota sp. GEM-RC1]